MRTHFIAALLASSATLGAASAAFAGDWDYKLGATGYLPTQDLKADWPANTSSDDYDWDNFSFGVTGEASSGRWSLIGDLLYADTEGSGSGIDSDASLTSLGAYAGYNLFDNGLVSVDALGGLRLQTVGLDYSLPGVGVFDSVNETWVEPVIGARAQIGQDGFYGKAAFDVGGFVNDAETYQAVGAVGYAFDSGWSAEAGWRYLDMEIPTSGSNTDLELSGPVFGVSYAF